MPPIPIPILNIYLIHRFWDEESGAQEETRDVTPIYINPCLSVLFSSQGTRDRDQIAPHGGCVQQQARGGAGEGPHEGHQSRRARRGPTWRGAWGCWRGAHAKQDTKASEDTLFWSEVQVPLDFSGPLTAFHSVRAEYGE